MNTLGVYALIDELLPRDQKDHVKGSDIIVTTKASNVDDRTTSMPRSWTWYGVVFSMSQEAKRPLYTCLVDSNDIFTVKPPKTRHIAHSLAVGIECAIALAVTSLLYEV